MIRAIQSAGLHAISHADRSWAYDTYEHSATILQCVLQARTHAIHLVAGFARNRHHHLRVAKPKFLPLFQAHYIDAIDNHVFRDIARIDLQFIQDMSRKQKYLPPLGMAGMVIALES